ncbi:hypothetical protein D9757_011315 [Collybiopsis confluens]|uniref:Uncharacterized protein n=1 Tax=Collybiopsis confluens TaxID=2823264 RepID=A0A8H5GNA0_9AGAR|nr:hypothetical protein D9757_011315 [Collybiopsis confluens]
MKKYELIVGTDSYGGTSIESDYIYSAEKSYDGFKALAELGVKVWPHFLSNRLALDKTVMHALLAKAVVNAGGFSEKIYQVKSLEAGRGFLRRGYVVKRNFSYEKRHVFLPDLHPMIDDRGQEFKRRNEDGENLLAQEWKLTKNKELFFALTFNPALLSLGEVRVYIAFGRVVEMLHTLSHNSAFPRTKERRKDTAESAWLRLQNIDRMRPPQSHFRVAFSQRWNQNTLWFNRDMIPDMSEDSGTNQVKNFALRVYDDLIRKEHDVLRGNAYQRGVCGMRVLIRIDIGLIWDDTPTDSSLHKYRFIVNEIQPGQCGLFANDKNARTSIIDGFIEGIQRGSLDG